MSFFDLLIPCPYDRAHMIYESKMQSHLFKCERNNRNINKVVCPFNSTHRVDKIEYMLHINSCTNRQVIEGHKYDIDGGQIFQPQPYIEPKLPPQEENWDEEPPCETYDPSIHTESSCVLRKPVGVSKSQRKLFYKQEIRRIGRIQDIEKEDSEDLKTDEELQSGSVDSEDLQENVTEKTRDVSVTDEYVKFSIDPSLGLGRGTTFRNKNPPSETRPGINSRSSVPVSSERINGQRGLLFSLSPLKETMAYLLRKKCKFAGCAYRGRDGKTTLFAFPRGDNERQHTRYKVWAELTRDPDISIGRAFLCWKHFHLGSIWDL